MNGNTDRWLSLSIDDKLLQFASFLSHMRKDYRLGAIVGVYILFKNNSPKQDQSYRADEKRIGAEITRVIIEEVFSSLTEFKNQDPLLIQCELEVIGLFGTNDELASPHRLNVLMNLLQDQEAIVSNGMIPHVLAVMLRIGFEGLRAVIGIAEKDLNGI